MTAFRRVVWIVLDSVGIGEMPDAADYGDSGSDTLGNIASKRPLHLPHLSALGLANIKPLKNLPPVAEPTGAFGRCALASPGKDTTTGHWEMAGIHLEKPFPVYPECFPRRSFMNSRSASGVRRSATARVRNRDHRSAWAMSMSAPARRSSTRRPTASSRSPRTKTSFPLENCIASARSRVTCFAVSMKWAG